VIYYSDNRLQGDKLKMNYKIPFNKPPITEALLDIRVEMSDGVEQSTLLSFYDNVKDKFPIKNEKYSWQGEVKFQGKGAPEIFAPKGNCEGYLCKAQDGKKIVQARFDGFTFNKLRPYQNWDIFSEEAKGLWNIYKEVINPKSVKRLALRYVNKIDIPLPMGDFKEYVLTVPEIASGMPQGLSTYFMRLEIPNADIQANSVITQTFKPLKLEATVLPLIFDIDVYRVGKWEPNSEEVWDVMNQLREFKNQIFLNSTTDKAKELFE